VSEPAPPPGAHGPADAVAPVCYRHPTRETYIRCNRCDRPICPECMVSAAVGFQCPECVAEGRKTVREPRTVFGGKVYARPGLVTTTLVGLCVAAYVVQVAVPSTTGKGEMFGLAVASGQWWRLITAGFLHLSLVHILFNMWGLWVLGKPLEARLGRVRFGVLYAVSLFAGSTVSYVFANPQGASVGASGAIFGLAGGMIVMAKRMQWNLSWLVGIVALNFLLPFVVANIDWHAHVGGLVAGMIVTAAFVYPPPRLRVVSAVVVVAVVMAVCVGLVAHRTQQIRQDPRYASVFQLGGVITGDGDFRPFP
jgi:membrane associated rhomboid family serine protease